MEYQVNKIYNVNCIGENGMCLMPNKSIDLIIIDPPYGTTNYYWDKFNSEMEYINFMSDVISQFERILKDTGSLYIFHNDFLKIVEIQNMISNSTNFKFKQLIVWNKRFESCEYEDKKNATFYRDLTNYQKYAEYILFYTFDSRNSLELFMENKNNFEEYKKYIECLLNAKNLTYNSDKIVKALYENIGYKSMQSARSISQRLFNMNYKGFGFLTTKQYDTLKDILNIDRSYEELKIMFNKGKVNYSETEDNKYTYNNLRTHHSVWNYNNVKSKDKIHETEKPVDLIQNIILHSSNEGDTILDCFMGSGTTPVACINTNRNYICYELDKKYFEVANKRIKSIPKSNR